MRRNGNSTEAVVLNVKIKLQGYMPEGIAHCYCYAYIQTHKCIYTVSKDIEGIFPLKAPESYNVITIEVTYSLTFIWQHFHSTECSQQIFCPS